jgi:hypothetical protein
MSIPGACYFTGRYICHFSGSKINALTAKLGKRPVRYRRVRPELGHPPAYLLNAVEPDSTLLMIHFSFLSPPEERIDTTVY